MRNPGGQFLSFAAIVAAAVMVCGELRAQTISMMPAPATPELHAPFLYAARPGTPFQFRVPATGQTPFHSRRPGCPRASPSAPTPGL
jgi:hypothetical protein